MMVVLKGKEVRCCVIFWSKYYASYIPVEGACCEPLEAKWFHLPLVISLDSGVGLWRFLLQKGVGGGCTP
jgi:hypothetical protein